MSEKEEILKEIDGLIYRMNISGWNGSGHEVDNPNRAMTLSQVALHLMNQWKLRIASDLEQQTEKFLEISAEFFIPRPQKHRFDNPPIEGDLSDRTYKLLSKLINPVETVKE